MLWTIIDAASFTIFLVWKLFLNFVRRSLVLWHFLMLFFFIRAFPEEYASKHPLLPQPHTLPLYFITLWPIAPISDIFPLNKFLFRITQEIQNKSSGAVELYPYAQITRNQKPVLEAGSMSGTLILHDGFIGVFNEDLEEYDYDDIKDKKVYQLI